MPADVVGQPARGVRPGKLFLDNVGIGELRQQRDQIAQAQPMQIVIITLWE